MSVPAAGWYPAPDKAGSLRLWDGERWLDQYRSAHSEGPAPSGAAVGPTSPPWWLGDAGADLPVRAGSTPPAAGFASFGQRLGAAVIDLVLFGVVAFLVGSFVSLVIIATSGELDDASWGLVEYVLSIVYYPVALGVEWAFNATGWSPGRAAVGIRIVAAGGGPPGAGRGLGRVLMSFVSALALLMGYLAMLWSPSKQTWHDGAAGTYVIRTRPG
jgi:uncharacterized RDD family membrane protein YckC